MSKRFRGYLPVVLDAETGGLNSQTDAVLQISAVLLDMDEEGQLIPVRQLTYEIQPFQGANLDPASLKIIKIDPLDPNRVTVTEEAALRDLFKQVHEHRKRNSCVRAILVGHNASFDQDFLNAASKRCNIKTSPFHPFSCLDTVSLSALVFGQTVLSKACAAAQIPFDQAQAHDAAYDCARTTQLFCHIVNLWKSQND